MKTRFEVLLEASLETFDKFVGKPISGRELIDNFFPDKIANPVMKYTPDAKKNAVVMVGPYCSGKTTFARKFVKEHPQFVYVSLDECAAEDIENMDPVETFKMKYGMGEKTEDDLGNRRFGLKLEAGHTNIIVDGNWMHINSRGALLRTLEELGYKTTIFLINPNPLWHQQLLRHRTNDVIAAKRTDTDFTEILKGTNVLEKFAKSQEISVESAPFVLEQDEDYLEELDWQRHILEQEQSDANVAVQKEYGIMYIGADQVCGVEIV